MVPRKQFQSVFFQVQDFCNKELKNKGNSIEKGKSLDKKSYNKRSASEAEKLFYVTFNIKSSLNSDQSKSSLKMQNKNPLVLPKIPNKLSLCLNLPSR